MHSLESLQSPACCIRKLYVKGVVAVAVLYGKVVVVLYCSTVQYVQVVVVLYGKVVVVVVLYCVRYVQVVVVLKVKFKMQDKEHGCYMSYNARYKHAQYIYSLQKPTAFLEKFN
jgi:hypothetical protein